MTLHLANGKEPEFYAVKNQKQAINNEIDRKEKEIKALRERRYQIQQDLESLCIKTFGYHDEELYFGGATCRNCGASRDRGI